VAGDEGLHLKRGCLRGGRVVLLLVREDVQGWGKGKSKGAVKVGVPAGRHGQGGGRHQVV